LSESLPPRRLTVAMDIILPGNLTAVKRRTRPEPIGQKLIARKVLRALT
jgi:hypothetical protein